MSIVLSILYIQFFKKIIKNIKKEIKLLITFKFNITLILSLILSFSSQTVFANTGANININANMMDVYLEHARKEASSGDIQTAVALYKKVLQQDKHRSDVRKELSNLLVNVYMEDPYSEDPAPYLTKEEQLNSKVPMLPGEFSINELSNIQHALNDTRISFQCLLALTHIYQEDFDSAIKIAHVLQQQSASQPVAYNLLGLAFKGSGSAAKARESFEKAIKLKSDYNAARINLAELYIEQKRFSEIESLLKPILGSGQEHRRACVIMARKFNAEGNAEAEKEWLARAKQDL